MAYQAIRNAADLASRLEPHISREDHWLDFKGLNAETGRPYAKGRDGKEECRLDVAQFANADGGALVYGAVEDNHVFSNYITVPNPQELVRWLDEVIKAHLEPVPALEVHVIHAATGENVVVANVPPSIRLVGHRPYDGYAFPIRTVDSRRFLTLAEIEARMQDNERGYRLRLTQIKEGESITLDAIVDRDLGHDDWRICAVLDDTVWLAKMGNVNLEAIVPLAYIRAVYRSPGPGATWVLDLSCYVSKHRHKPLIVVTKDLPFGRNHGHYRVRGMDDGG